MNERGSIFVETIVAAAIVAMILGVLFQTIASGVARSTRLSAASGAVLVAQSRLAEVGGTLPLSPGTVQGTEGRFRWRIEISPYGAPGPAGTPALVSVTVAAPGLPGAVTLRTVRLG